MLGLQEAGERIRVKADTARGYLRSVFAKTGVIPQAELIRLILVSLVRTTDDLRYEVIETTRPLVPGSPAMA